MKGKSWIAANRELAFRLYCENGGNVERTLEGLKRAGLSLSRPVFYEWIKKFQFEERRIKVDAEVQKTKDIQISFDERLLNDLIRQKERYDSYFDELGGQAPDNQAMNAYTSLVKAIGDLKERTGRYKVNVFVDFMREYINWVAKNDPEELKVIERHFDDFSAYIRDRYN